MNRVYIAREVGGDTRTFLNYIANEAVFDSFETAEQYLKLQEPEAAVGSVFQIVSYAVGSDPEDDQWDHAQYWIYDLDFNLIEESMDAFTHQRQIQAQFDAEYGDKFKVGDVVRIKRTEWYPERIGVVAAVPDPPPPAREFGMDPDGTYSYYIPDYTVEYLGYMGCLDHDHVLQRFLEPFEDEIPEDLAFIGLLRDHYRGIRRIKESSLHEMVEGRLTANDIRKFGEEDFED